MTEPMSTAELAVLQRQLEETSARFEVGEITRTDVAQAEASLAQSEADLANAQAQLSTTRAAYAALSPAMLDKIAELRTVNVFQGSAAKKKSFRNAVKKHAVDDNPVIHPLIRTVPETGGQSHLHAPGQGRELCRHDARGQP